MRRATTIAVSVVFLGGATAKATDEKAPSFTKDIQPFLTTYCVECHGAGKPKAGVRVDSYEALIKAGKKTLVVAGKPADSHLLLTLDGKGKKMPPKKYAAQPTAKEIAVVKAWIAAGARDDSAKTDAAPAVPLPLQQTTAFIFHALEASVDGFGRSALDFRQPSGQ